MCASRLHLAGAAQPQPQPPAQAPRTGGGSRPPLLPTRLVPCAALPVMRVWLVAQRAALRRALWRILRGRQGRGWGLVGALACAWTLRGAGAAAVALTFSPAPRALMSGGADCSRRVLLSGVDSGASCWRGGQGRAGVGCRARARPGLLAGRVAAAPLLARLPRQRSASSCSALLLAHHRSPSGRHPLRERCRRWQPATARRQSRAAD